MLGSLARHSFGAILLAVIIEELGGPDQLATAGALLSRSGWDGIAVQLLLVALPALADPRTGAVHPWRVRGRPCLERAHKTRRPARPLVADRVTCDGVRRRVRRGHLRPDRRIRPRPRDRRCARAPVTQGLRARKPIVSVTPVSPSDPSGALRSGGTTRRASASSRLCPDRVLGPRLRSSRTGSVGLARRSAGQRSRCLRS